MPTVRGRKTSARIPKGTRAPKRRAGKQTATRKSATKRAMKIKKGF